MLKMKLNKKKKVTEKYIQILQNINILSWIYWAQSPEWELFGWDLLQKYTQKKWLGRRKSELKRGKNSLKI